MSYGDKSAASSIELHLRMLEADEKVPATLRNNRKTKTEDFCMKMTCLVNCGNFLLFHNYDKTTTPTELIDISF